MEEINISRDQYISAIEPFKSTGIPTNSIVHKTITGCGMTTFEIRFAKHHSIIVLPNRPVIEDKVSEHNEEYPEAEILGVHKGIDVDDIKAYLLKKVKYKKILCTPEAFKKKVLKAFEKQMDELKQNYFLLYDEAERIITDISYRGEICAPMDIFFKFKSKALVSATTLPFSDPRFENFTHYVIKPDYDYSKQLTVINTNNVITSLKQQLDKLNSEHVCIFINSTKGIHAIAEALNISSKSKAYCAQPSVVKLLGYGYFNGSSNFDKNKMAQYNFFTSRYFSAIDIKLDYKPDVIMVSDIFFADHSILDPHTEIIQIPGRFRNGVNSITHITNFNPLLETKTPEEALTYLNGCLDTFEHIVRLFESSNHKGAKDTLDFFLKNSPIANFFNDGKRVSFMIDNDLNQERVKTYYLDIKKLKTAYDEIADHYMATYVPEEWPVGDGDNYKLSKQQTKKEKFQQVAILIDRYTTRWNHFVFLSDAVQEQKDFLMKKYPVIARAYSLIGLAGLEQTGYELSIIKKAISAAEKSREILRLAPFVQAAFSENTSPEEEDVLRIIANVYQENKANFKAASSHIARYFNARRSTRNGGNVYNIKEKYTKDLIQKK